MRTIVAQSRQSKEFFCPLPTASPSFPLERVPCVDYLEFKRKEIKIISVCGPNLNGLMMDERPQIRWQDWERIMFELRLYNRRPSCLIRYRHGGYAAIFPLGQKNVMDITATMTGTGDIAITADTPETGKVLPFPGQTERPGRKKNTRLKGRPNGRKKT